jgi:hypothetical protein
MLKAQLRNLAYLSGSTSFACHVTCLSSQNAIIRMKFPYMSLKPVEW